MNITGRVHEIGATQQVTDTFKKRDIIIAYAENPQFVEYVRFEATNDKTDIFNNLQIGQEVEVSFNLRGRPWTNKDGVTTYFNSLVAWRVKPTTAGMQPNENPQDYGNDYPAPVDLQAGDDEDDLPF